MTITKYIFVIIGPAGCGKTTLARYLAQVTGLPMIEGDEYHTEANKTKMANETPLNDTDRLSWLTSLGEAAVKTLERGGDKSAVFVTCSALRKKYRDILRLAVLDKPGMNVIFVYLKVEEEILVQRVEKREGHYMKKGMVRGQMEILEVPESEGDATVINGERTVEDIAEELMARMGNLLLS